MSDRGNIGIKMGDNKRVYLYIGSGDNFTVCPKCARAVPGLRED